MSATETDITGATSLPGVARRPAARPLRDALRAAARAASVPLTANLELTKRCNLECVHCYVAGRDSELSSERWLELIDELERAGTLHVTLTGGEVAMRDDFFAIAARVKQRRMSLTVLTNGTMFDEADADRLAGLHPTSVAVSLYGASAPAHESVTGVAGSFERSVATLTRLRERGVRCRISCTLMTETIDHFPAIIDLATQLDCDYMFDPTVVPMSDGDPSVLQHRLPAERLREFYFHERVLNRFADYLSRADVTAHHEKTGSCGAGMTALHVEANGDVLPCTGFRPAFGNVDERPLAAIWSGPRAEAHRSRMSAPVLGCEGCRKIGFCSQRCPRLAQFETGDLAGRSSRVCDIVDIIQQMAVTIAANADS
jgi:radical SAM protein with 4Fe4S-binding SPASM domain